MPKTYSRADWGARAARPGPGALTASRVRGLAVHWPAMSKQVHGPEAVFRLLRNIQAFHMDGHGWSDIAYQVAVDQDGNRYELRGLHTQSGANGDNEVNEEYGAMLLILATGEQLTDAMIDGVRDVVHDFRTLYPKGLAIKGHGQVRPEPTACPGAAAQTAVNAGTFEPRAPHPPKPTPLVELDTTRVGLVNMHAPGLDDRARMKHGYDRIRHLDFTIVAFSELNAAMAAVFEDHPHMALHRAKPNSGTSGNALASWSPVWRFATAENLRVPITDRTLTMAGAVLEHKRTGVLQPVLAIHNPPRAGKSATLQVDRDICLEAERDWAAEMTQKYGRALVLGDFNQPKALGRPLVRGAAHDIDQVYGRGVTFSKPRIHPGFLDDGITDHRAVSVLINV